MYERHTQSTCDILDDILTLSKEEQFALFVAISQIIVERDPVFFGEAWINHLSQNTSQASEDLANKYYDLIEARQIN